MELLLWSQDDFTVTASNITVQFRANRFRLWAKKPKPRVRITDLIVKPAVQFVPLKDILKKIVTEYLVADDCTLLPGLLYHIDHSICNNLS